MLGMGGRKSDPELVAKIMAEKERLTTDVNVQQTQHLDHKVGFGVLPVENAMERRAICLRDAIDTKSVAMSLKSDPSPAESALAVLEAARLYEAYIMGADLVD